MTVQVSDNWMRAMNAIADALKAQALEDVGGDIRVQTEPFTERVTRPGCYVTPEKRKRNESLCTNEREAYGYGCQVTVVRGGSRSFGESPDRPTQWVETASRLFHKKRFWSPRYCDKLLPAIVDEPADSEERDEAIQKQTLDAVSIVVRAWVQEKRE
jgi:hypothetical protein